MGTRGQGLLKRVNNYVYETQWNTEDKPNHPETECRKVENVDEECLDRLTKPGTPLGTWGVDYGWPWETGRIPVARNVCYDAVWDALDECAGPGGWEYGDSDTGEGPGVLESIYRTTSEAAYWIPSAMKSAADAWRDW
ncbi:MAG: hypothetical protein JJE52_03725 [Acidimicrobiia bacterium]|nr:hypothetical protein [Acidimicrobiia bacterium]